MQILNKRRLFERIFISLALVSSIIFLISSNTHEIGYHVKPNLQNKRLFCLILTHKVEFYDRAILVNKTWAPQCDKYFFLAKRDNSTQKSKEFLQPIPILQPEGLTNDTYSNLTSKIYTAFKDIYKRYNDYDWYLKADHDTFIFVDNLREFLRIKNKSEPITFGYNFKTIVKDGYHSGGAGYVLSNEALKRFGHKLITNYSKCFNTGTEDVDVGRTLRDLNVYMGNSKDEFGRERFHPLNINAHLNGVYPKWLYQYAQAPLKNGSECCSASSISFHYMSTKEIIKTHALWEERKNSLMGNSSHNKFIEFLHEVINS